MIRITNALRLHYLICKVNARRPMVKSISPAIFLVPKGRPPNAGGASRRSLKARARAASRKLPTPPNSIEPQLPQYSTQLRLDDALCNGTHPTRRQCAWLKNRQLTPTAEDVSSLSGLRQWLTFWFWAEYQQVGEYFPQLTRQLHSTAR